MTSLTFTLKRLVAAGLLGLTTIGLSAFPASAAVTPQLVNNPWTAACKQVLFIGARGSGQLITDHNGLGTQVYDFMTNYTSRLNLQNVGYYPVNFEAQAVAVLLTDRGMYFSGVDTGVTDIINVVNTRRAACPNEHYVLAGYSQGAMVVHRAVWQLAGSTQGFNNIDGVVVIADGDRVPGQGGNRYGTSPDTSVDYGVSFVVPSAAGNTYKPRWQNVPATVADRFHSICDSGDIVCDFGRTATAWSQYQGIRTHVNHYKGTSTTTPAAAVAGYSNNHAYTPPPLSGSTGTVLASPCLNFRSGPNLSLIHISEPTRPY